MYQIARVGVIRMSDGLRVRKGTREWQEYLEWAKTNAPLPELVDTPTTDRPFNARAAGAAREEREVQRLSKTDPIAALKRKVGMK